MSEQVLSPKHAEQLAAEVGIQISYRTIRRWIHEFPPIGSKVGGRWIVKSTACNMILAGLSLREAADRLAAGPDNSKGRP